ncbi:ATP-dependent DNA helicase [Mycena maculata]|uniref:DNA 3'-5' helicase n=1 Tax=Mycena maculata TaxID=230809 RepID=A0AAD7IXS4_9AGAR|nr:ATP-dependent DNA helicase [Mycena maculata]
MFYRWGLPNWAEYKCLGAPSKAGHKVPLQCWFFPDPVALHTAALWALSSGTHQYRLAYSLCSPSYALSRRGSVLVNHVGPCMASNNEALANWPPIRVHGPYMATPAQTPLRTPSTDPKTPSYRPFSLNNPGSSRQKAFNLSKPTPLSSIPALDPTEWNTLALESHAIPIQAQLHSYQIQISNLVLMRRWDAVVIAPTGSGKSLSWTLPLLARKEGISLVITPFTSLGLDGQISNNCDGILSLFIYSDQNTQEDFEKVATGEMLVVYVCPEMLESLSFARLIHSKSWQGRISGIYIDEAHLIHQTHVWQPPYSRIYLLRNIIGHDTPLIALSATCPEQYRNSLVMFAGLHPNYTLINLGNFRPELSTIILPMKHDISSFLDLAFILPFGCSESSLAKVKSIVYCDDLDLLTKMFWWAFSRAASMGIPTHAIDIIHSGLSARHQELALDAFRDGPTSILLGSSKISAGMNFPGVRRVIQYKCADLTVPDVDQRRGRGARRKGESAVGIIFVEPRMWRGGDFSIQNPGDQDPGMIELIQSEDCIEEIIQRRLENPPHVRHHSCDCCNHCDPSLHPGREYQWIEVNPAPSTDPTPTVKSTDAQRESVYHRLIQWRLQHWRSDWRDRWPSYGPKALIPDSDLEDLAKHTSKIFSVEDMRQYTHIVHWSFVGSLIFFPK